MFSDAENLEILLSFSTDDAGKKIRDATEIDFAEWIAAHTNSFWDNNIVAIEQLEKLQYQWKIMI